jgi:hypothetical protein
VCVVLCAVFRFIVVLFCVMCVNCLLCLVVLPLSPSKTNLQLKQIIILNLLYLIDGSKRLLYR